jgi:autotransporter-associated beta strand protein
MLGPGLPRSVSLIDFTHLTAASILLVTFQNKSVTTYHSGNIMTRSMKNSPRSVGETMRSFFWLHRPGDQRLSKSWTPQIERMESRVQLSAVAWTGSGGDNNWDNPLNWSTDALPGSADDVAIEVAANVVHSSAVTDSIRSLTSSQPLTLSGGTISIASASSTSGPVVIDGGTLAGTGDITVGGPLTLTAGTIAGFGKVIANGGIVINPSGTAFSLDGRTLTNSAGQTATWTGADSNVQASNGAIFDNLGTFQAENQGAFTQGSGALTTFIDAGSFTKMTSNGELDFSGVGFNATNGSVDVQSGTLGLQGGGTETAATFSIANGSTLDFAGSTAFSLDSDTTFSGAGNLTKDGPTTLALQGNSASFTGPTTVKSGTLVVNGSQPASAVTVASGGTLEGTGTVGAITTSGGTVSPGDGALTGILNVNGNVTFDPTAVFTAALDGTDPGTGYDQLNVAGAVNLNGSTLDPSVGFSPGPQGFTIIQSTATIVGSFNARPQGSTLFIGATPFTISYTGNNVVLTRVGPASPPRISTQNSTTFTVGTTGAFTVTATGGPPIVLTETGTLPGGVSFVDNGGGSGSLAGKPDAGAGVTYHISITASNGQLPNAVQNFMLIVNEAPSITSASSAPFVTGTAGTFTVTTTGFPAAALSESGPLPSGLHFVDNGNGTAALEGTADAGTQGVYNFMITGTNGVGTDAHQNFSLTVSAATQAPVITSAGSATFAAGSVSTFLVTATGSPTPTLSVSGTLPAGMTFVDNGNGTGTLTVAPAANTTGSFQLTIVAQNGIGTPATQEFISSVAIETAPRVARLQRLKGGLRTRFVLTFDEPMNSALAQQPTNYVFHRVVKGRVLSGPRNTIKVQSALYNETTHTVTLKTKKQLSLNQVYQITVSGGTSGGLTNVSGVALDGLGNGAAGSSFTLSFKGRASLKGIPGPGNS